MFPIVIVAPITGFRPAPLAVASTITRVPSATDLAPATHCEDCGTPHADFI